MYGINKIPYISICLPPTEVDCDACVSEFAANGGCDSRVIDVSDLIPDGCSSCGDKANEYCESISGKLL